MLYFKKIRIAISLLFFLPIFLFFIDFTGKLPPYLHQLLSIQWIPSLLSFNMVLLGILLVLSLLLGRFYCSSICPLGILQDIIAWKASFFRKKKNNRFHYRKPQNILRYSILGLTLLMLILGSNFLVLLLDPYSNFGRICAQIIKPILIFANNSIANATSNMGNYTFHEVNQGAFVPIAFSISLFFVIIITVLSWSKGRLYCNTICPVGSGLGLISKISLFKIGFDESTCNKCGLCEQQCKSECIDSKNSTVDDTRCVSCFNCFSVCKKGGVKYEYRYNKSAPQASETSSNASRRTFLFTSGAILATAAFAAPKKILSKNDLILDRKPIMPPGAFDRNHFNSHCTGCQLCVSKCPMQVLKPASLQYGIQGITQAHLVFSTEVFCSFDCNICSTICPTGALKPLELNDKKRTQLGIAKFRKNKCEVYVHEKDCGACSEHCPTQAVHMIPYKNGLTIPEVTENLCIGCGACESICPVHPYPSIYVEGAEKQTLAVKPKEAEKFNKKVNDLGF